MNNLNVFSNVLIRKYKNLLLNYLLVDLLIIQHNMIHMFLGSQFDGDISKWNVSNVTDMSCMFKESKFDGDISKWDVSNVTNMEVMFSKSQFNNDFSEWDVSNVMMIQFL